MRTEDEMNQATKLADLLDRVAAALEVLQDDRLPSNDELDETVTKLESLAKAKEAWDDLPSDDGLEETAAILERIDSAKSAYDSLPDNDALEESAEILGRIEILLGQLPANGELDATIVKLERIAQLRKETAE